MNEKERVRVTDEQLRKIHQRQFSLNNQREANDVNDYFDSVAKEVR